MAFINTVVARAAAGIWGLKLGSATTQAVQGQAFANGGNLDPIINNAFNNSYANLSNAAVAAIVVGNLGLTGAAATEGTAYIVSQLALVPANARGAELSKIINLFSQLGANPTFGAAANDFNARVAAAVVYSSIEGNPDAVLGNLPSASSFFLLGRQDNITGTAGNDTFNAFIFDNANTLQSGDFIDGGAGVDTLYADMGSSAAFAVTPITRSIEIFQVRAQSRQPDSGDNNVAGENRVIIDAERMQGFTRLESNNSRADLIIEDVRIGASQITKDVTIAFVQSDPGVVDFGVYFDQASLRANSTSSAALTLQVIDLKAAGAAATANTPLLDSPYDGISFTVNGSLVFLTSSAIGNATTYPALLAAIQSQLALNPLTNGVVTAALGGTFTVNDSQTLQPVTGTSIVLSGSNISFGIGNWIASQGVPGLSNLYTNQFAGTTATNDLVTSTIVLDDVGRGSNGGDLVIGGLSVGETSASRGVDRFEITVERTSRLMNIDSTNNWLKEVVLRNGTTNGNISVLGNLTTSGGDAGVIPGGINENSALPGAVAQHDGFGFNDVRLIDASAMRGTVTFDAAITALSFGKYVLTGDTAPNPGGDNTSTPGQTTQVADFIYTGGLGNDSMTVAIDSGVASSRNNILSGREDFTFNLSGGAGNDTISVTINPLAGGFQNWYNNQQLNANIRIDGGDGNDTIRTPGAGDAIIFGGSGNDTIYVDNTGAQATTQGSENDAGRAYANAAAAELATGISFRLASLNTDAVVLAARSTALDTLNLLTPISFTDPAVPANPNPLLPTKAALETAIDAARTAGAITVEQQLALYNAYATRAVGSTIVVATTVSAVGATISAFAAPVNALLQAAEFAAGNALLDTYIAAANSARSSAVGADNANASYAALLNPTQTNVVLSTGLVNREGSIGDTGGTATLLNNLNAVNTALAQGATEAAVVAALNASIQNGSRTAVEANALFTAAGGVGTVTIDAAEFVAVQAILALAINAATLANTTATTLLATRVAADNTAIRTAAGIVGAAPYDAPLAIVPQDSVGATEAAAAASAAATAVSTFSSGTLSPLTTVQTALATLKTALALGVADLQATILINNAAAAATITGGTQVALLAEVALAITNLSAAEKAEVDRLITIDQRTNDVAVSNAQATLANLQSVATATAFASAQAAAAAAAFGPSDIAPFGGLAAPATSNGQWVLNTSNQQAITTTPGSGYVLAVNDERNIFDLRSDVNNTYNLHATRLTVDFKGLTSVVTVPSTNFRTTDLQVNQAIKDAINNNAVLNKLIIASDGPANSLIVRSLIDGVMTEAMLSITLAVPGVAGLSPADIAAAAGVYGVAANEAAVLAALAAAKVLFDTKGDYIDRLAETGAVGGNAPISGAASVTTSDNTVTPGGDNDVIVLGTTTGSEMLLSSNDTVVFGGSFGNDTIVNFRAGSLATGGDVLNFAALGGTTLTTAFNVNRSINVGEEVVGTNGTAALVAGLFVDSATVQTHVYVAFDTTTNIGKVYVVTDAAGTGAGSVTATLAGTIDLADTLWATLTTDNFGG